MLLMTRLSNLGYFWLIFKIKFKRDSGVKIYQYILGNEQFEELYGGGSDKRPNIQEAFKFFRDFEREFQRQYPG